MNAALTLERISREPAVAAVIVVLLALSLAPAKATAAESIFTNGYVPPHNSASLNAGSGGAFGTWVGLTHIRVRSLDGHSSCWYAFNGAGLLESTMMVEARTGGVAVASLLLASGATCVAVSVGRVLCAHAECLKWAGASASWNVPSPAQQADGEGDVTFRGLAVGGVATIAVIDDVGRELARTSPKHSVFALQVPFAAKPASLVLTGAGTRSVIQVN